MTKLISNSTNNSGSGPIIPSGISNSQMYGPMTHKALLDRPTGRPILSGRRKTSAYKENVRLLQKEKANVDVLKDRLIVMFEFVDKDEIMKPWEREQLAANIQFLMIKKLCASPLYENVNLHVVSEDDRRFRINARAGTRIIVAGAWQDQSRDVLNGLKVRADEMIYGSKKEYVG